MGAGLGIGVRGWCWGIPGEPLGTWDPHGPLICRVRLTKELDRGVCRRKGCLLASFGDPNDTLIVRSCCQDSKA